MALDFTFTPEQDAFRQRIKEMVEKEIRPYSSRWDKKPSIPWKAVRAMAEVGLMGHTYPRRVGGREGSWVDFAIALEEIGRRDQSCGWIVLLSNAYPKVVNDDDLWRRVVNGDVLVALSETEPQSGGDATGIETSATRDGDRYVIDGRKVYISLVPGAQYHLVTAVTDPAAGPRGISMFLVDASSPGITTKSMREMGVRAHMLSTVRYKNVEVPADRLVGKEGDGFRLMRSQWDFTRGVSATLFIGAALQSIEETVERAKRQVRFGRPMLKWQAPQFKLSDNLTALHACQLLAYKAAWMADRGERITAYASMFKTFVVDVVHKALWDCVQIWGGAAYLENSAIGQRYRDFLGWQLSGGGEDVHRIIVGMEYFGREWSVHRD
jgi:alkylation response protein AidB-like acyl-CoA dehydrogenase